MIKVTNVRNQKVVYLGYVKKNYIYHVEYKCFIP